MCLIKNIPFVCTPSDGQENCSTTPDFNTTWQIKPQYQDGWGYSFPPGSEDPERLSPPALPAGLRELPLFPGDRNVKRTAEPREYNLLTLTHLYRCSGTLHKQRLFLPATWFQCFGLGLCPQDLCRLPFVVLDFFLRYSLHIKAFFLGALTPAASPRFLFPYAAPCFLHLSLHRLYII